VKAWWTKKGREGFDEGSKLQREGEAISHRGEGIAISPDEEKEGHYWGEAGLAYRGRF